MPDSLADRHKSQFVDEMRQWLANCDFQDCSIVDRVSIMTPEGVYFVVEFGERIMCGVADDINGEGCVWCLNVERRSDLYMMATALKIPMGNKAG